MTDELAVHEKAASRTVSLRRHGLPLILAGLFTPLGFKFVSWMAGRINAHAEWPVPYEVLPGAAVWALPAVVAALVMRKPRRAAMIGLVTVGLGVGFGLARQHVSPHVGRLTSAAVNTRTFSVTVIIAVIAGLGWGTWYILRLGLRPDQTGVDRAPPVS